MLEYRSFATGPKRSMGMYWGPKKAFFNSLPSGGLRCRGRRFNPVIPRQRRSPRGSFRQARAPVNSHHRQRVASGTIGHSSQHTCQLERSSFGQVCFRALRYTRAPHCLRAAQADYPLPDLPREASRADLPPQKVCNLDPMAPRPRQKRQITRGPPARQRSPGPHTTPAIVNYNI